jgi:phosphopantothenoylcysteine decarboxylase/phosphopantothenate--cysteine ligase
MLSVGLPHLVITSGPTWEPIDAVRYLGNRSSGKLGASVSLAAAARGWRVTHLAGPNSERPEHAQIQIVDFESCADLQEQLALHMTEADVLIMAAAVADYRPVPEEVNLEGKRRRKGDMTLSLEATPDLLKGCSATSRGDQLLVGFALEPAERLVESALGKLERKQIDAIVANPLDTMGADSIEALFITAAGEQHRTPGHMTKPQFAAWLIDRITPAWRAKAEIARDARVGSSNQ